MPTHAEISVRLLTEAASFFKTLGDQNASITTQMKDNAKVFEQMAGLIGRDPQGAADGRSYADLTATLLQDAANFFRSLGEQNEPIREQMLENATVYEQIAGMVRSNPLGVLE